MPHSSAFFVYLTMETILEIFIISGHNGQCVYVCMLSFSLLQLRLRLVGLLICVVEGFLGGGRERDEGDIVCVCDNFDIMFTMEANEYIFCHV